MTKSSGTGGTRRPSRRKPTAPDRSVLVSHEIRGPLGVVMTLSEMLLARDLPEPDRRVVELIRLAGQHVFTVAEDLVAEASLAADRLRITNQCFDPADLVRSVVALWAPIAEERDRILEIDVSEAPATMVSDENRIRQILFNLISNATKFAPNGRIRVSLRRDEATGRAIFEVTDEGVGLPNGFRLEPFVSATDRTGPGAGIGLWISAKIATALSATFELMNRPEGGTLARLDVPLEPVEPARAAPARKRRRTTGKAAAPTPAPASPTPDRPLPGDTDLTDTPHAPDPVGWPEFGGQDAQTAIRATPLAGLKVLVVDDSSVSRMLMTAVLTSFDMVVTTAASSGEAEPLALACGPDLILLDWSLAGESGADVLERLDQSAAGPLPPVIVISASDRLPAGLDIAGHLKKPFTPRQIYRAITDALMEAGAVESAG